MKLRLFLVATLFVASSIAEAQLPAAPSTASAESAKRAYPASLLFQVSGSVVAMAIVNEEGASTSAGPNVTVRIKLNATTRQDVTTLPPPLAVSLSTDPGFCGSGTQNTAYVNGNEVNARMIHNQAMMAKSTGDSLTLWVEKGDTNFCHIYVLWNSVPF